MEIESEHLETAPATIAKRKKPVSISRTAGFVLWGGRSRQRAATEAVSELQQSLSSSSGSEGTSEEY